MNSNAEALISEHSEFDLDWFAQLQLRQESALEGIQYETVYDPENGVWWRLASAEPSTPFAGLLHNEQLISSYLNEAWAERPLAFLELERRTSVVFPERLGQPIGGILSPQGFEHIAAFLDFSINAAASLSLMHEAGILHRSINSGNVIVEEAGAVRYSAFAFSTVMGAVSLAVSHAPSLGDMPYVPPEQTRRDQPTADRRSDLYSLGVVLYQALTGELPLKAVSMTQWLHAHVAIEPNSPSAVRSAVPPVLDSIILKLIAKDPNNRYQSAHALHADLLRCREEYSATGTISNFPLARADLPIAGTSGQQLFGRTRELRKLVDAAERATRTGKPELIFIHGAPGIGKSALVERLPELIGPEFRYASGKSSLLLKDIPYSSFAQILRSLVTDALLGSNEALEEIKQKLIVSLTGYGSLLVDLVPEAEFLVGATSVLPDAPVNVAQSRMVRIIVHTLAVFASKTSPLIIFLDDLQWADDSTHAALKALLEHELPHVLIILAYREGAENIQTRLDDYLQLSAQHASKTTQIYLRPMTLSDTAELIASTLKDMPGEDLGNLARLVQKRTDGNAFFASQYLRTLVSDQAINYDLELQRWTWDETVVPGYGVIDFLVERMHALPTMQRHLLEDVALMGGQTEADLLSRLHDLSSLDLEALLKPLIQGGFLGRRSEDYSIPHDRVLEAALNLTNPEERPTRNLQIARVMADMYGEAATDRIFEIARHIEIAASESISLSGEDRSKFARILMVAGRKLRNAGAVEQALGYLDTARLMLADTRSVLQRSVSFELEFLYCECLISLARIEDAESSTDVLLGLSDGIIEQSNVFRLRAVIATVQSDYENAIAHTLEGLALLKIDLPKLPSPEECDLAYDVVHRRLAECTLEKFIALPEVKDAAIKSAMALLSTLTSSFFVEGGLSFLHTAKLVELSLDHGVTPDSAYGLAWFGVYCASRYGIYAEGLEYASAATTLALRDGFEAHRTATLVALDQVTPWTEPLQDALARAREAAEVGYAENDLGMTCYARNHIISDLIVLGTHLSVLTDEIEQGLILVRQINYKDIEYILESQSFLVRTLQRGDYSDRAMDKERSIRSIPTLYWTDFYEGITAYFFQDYSRASYLLQRAMEFAWSVPAHIDFAYGHFFSALTHAKIAHQDVEAAIERLEFHRLYFVTWDRLNPTTFRSKLALIDAEIARLKGDTNLAARLYEAAINAAEAAGFVHEQALAHELAGTFYEANDLFTAARSHFQAAFICYSRWGADGKASHMQENCPKYFLVNQSVSENAISQAHHDLAVVMKSAQTLSEEIVLERVVGTLMTDMIIHAGAQYGLLLMMRDGQPFVEARARVVQHEVVLDVGPSAPTAQELPLWTLNAVIRTKKTIVFTDAIAEAPRMRIDGPEGRNLRSVMCLPLNKRGTLVGLIYLENNLAPGVFTSSRISMLELLAPQAAISLEAARLYREVAEENSRRARAETELMQARAELVRNSQLTVLGSLAASISHEINQPLASIVSHADASVRWLKREEPDVEEALIGLKEITENGLRAAGIVKALRSIAKQAPATLVRTEINDVISEVLRLTSPEIEKNRVRLVTQLPPEPNIVMADPVQLQQVVLNLVTNAVDALSDLDLPRRELFVHAFRQEEKVTVKVEDRGRGIDAAILQKIFDPFFSTKVTGMGMGLAICQSIMDAHGSRLIATSTPGTGTTFTFTLECID